MLRRFASSLTLASVLTIGAQLTGAPAVHAIEPDPPAALISAEEAIGIAIRRSVDANRTAAKDDREALSQFYIARNSQPLWIENNAIGAKGKAIAEEIARAGDWGLDASRFALPNLDLGDGANRDALAEAEAKLSLAALAYARDARGGRIPDPREMSSYLDRDPQLISPVKVLEALAATSDPGGYLAGLNPQHEQFKRLRAKLLELRGAETAEAKADRPVRIPEDGPTLSPGTTHPDVALLRQRLKVEAVATDGASAEPERYDDALVAAVKSYQRDNGMRPDGIVGRRTRTSFNGGGEDRRKIDEGLLIANMEEWRWMPDDLGETHVWVNLPEFLVRVVKDGKVIHEERIITGKVDNQTPVFSHELETVVMHPFWGVPESIKVKELLPSLARGSTLSRQGLRLQYNGRDVDATQIDWSKADIRRYHVYQPPGDSNVLGVVKFLFPNKHQVYMHDTPTKDLFNSSSRTFSHGCMRVRNPMKLAEVVLREDKGWSADQVQTLLRDGPENNNIQLEKKIPVHVTYFTARVDDDGQLVTRPDIYLHEKRIRLALAGRWKEIPRHRDHLAPVPYVRPQIVQNEYGSNSVENFFKNVFGGF